ncbi:MAG: glycosyltransferase family 39 protein [Anaerolineae bacterium]
MIDAMSVRRREVFIAAGLWLLALIPRLIGLGRFLTIDEVKWVEGAGQFLLGLTGGDLAQTNWHFHPGITITWGEALILWLRWLGTGGGPDLASFTNDQLADLPGLIGSMRLSGAIITSLMVPALYLLARRLLGEAPALLGAALLALDPFFLAHSRIVNGDAGAAGFMLLSLLAFLWLWQGSRWRMAVVSGVLGGLALLTKLPSPLLVPWISMLALTGYAQRRDAGFWLKALALWGVAAVVTFVLLWPAMWVAPLTTLQSMVGDAFTVGQVGRGHSAFFRGQISDDPGWAFYPIAVAFRLTPLTTIGLGLTILWLVLPRRGATTPSARWIAWSLIAYAVFVVLSANTSPKKLDRYVMAVFPALDLWVAVGLCGVWRALTDRRPQLLRGSLVTALAVVALQGAFALTHYPYLLTSYNPLLGGLPKAIATVPVGWGEGLERAAAWLNAQPEAEKAEVSAWYSDIFFPYFVGERASFSSSGKSQLAADYVVFYVNQLQRQRPYPALTRYFQEQDPAYTVRAQGAALAWVYRAPGMGVPMPGKVKIEGRAELLGLDLPDAPLEAGQAAAVRLYFRPLGLLPENEAWQVSLVDGAGNPFVSTLEPAASWTPDRIMEYDVPLQLPPDLPAGDYRLRVSLWDKTAAQPVTQFAIPDSVAWLEVRSP